MKLNFQRQTGVTLVELVTFIVIVSVAMVGLMGAYSSILTRAPSAAQITQATQLAQERMELILAQKDVQGYASLALDPCPASAVCPTLPTGFSIPTPVPGTDALVAWTAVPGDTDDTSRYRLITVTVTGPQGTQLTQLQSVLAND